jgi:ABC-type nitrate/sulfonate/bicarbonate transport system permease component
MSELAVSTFDRLPSRATRVMTSDRTLRVLSVVGVLAIWELLGRQAPLFASYPTQILVAFWETTVTQNRLIPALAVTLQALAVGFAISAVLGVGIGFLMGRIRIVELVLDPYVSALYSTPRITLIPVLILWLGVDFELRVTMCVLSAVFPIIINVHAGVKAVDRELIDTGRAFAATSPQILRTVVFPASLPYIFTGLRVGIARALVGIVVAEMSAAVTGTGYLLLFYGRYFQTDKLMGPVIVLGLVSILLAVGVSRVQRLVMPWVARGQER